jgi:hypothetical protein
VWESNTKGVLKGHKLLISLERKWRTTAQPKSGKSRVNIGYLWRRRVGVEPTIRSAKERIAGFEGREDHRTLFASVASIASKN